MPNKPEIEFRAGGNITAAVWKEEKQDGDRTYNQYTVKIQKQFKKAGESEYKPTNYYFRDDLPKLQLVVQKAYEYICLKTRDNIPV